MNFRSGRRREELDINITPLIDVVFLLLIFFMVSTTFNKSSEISIQLPQAAGQIKHDKRVVVEVSIDAEGHFYINKQQLINTRLETLKRAMKAQAGNQKDPKLVISADRRTPHGSVVRAMDAARQLGFVHLTFATQNNPAEQ